MKHTPVEAPTEVVQHHQRDAAEKKRQERIAELRREFASLESEVQRLTTPTPISAAPAASDTSRVDEVTRLVHKINTEAERLASAAWNAGLHNRSEDRLESTARTELLRHVGRLQVLALGAEAGA